MVYRDISNIEIPYFVWKKVKSIDHVNPNVAFDTETVKGRCFLISDSEGDFRDIDDLYTLLYYLNQKKYRDTVNWFYNLEYDTNAILKYLDFKRRQQIAFFNYVDYEDFKIRIIPKKELKISKIKKDGNLHHTTSFYDLAQFYEMQPLKKLAEKTDYAKVDVEDIQNINLEKYQSDIAYRKLIQDRCIIDCKITKQLADQFTDNINKIVKINKYKSKASIARRYVLENISHSLKLPSPRILQAALNSYHAGHIEACKLGIFKNIVNYDINSAYPSFTAVLYDTTGVYRHNYEYEPDTAYSFYLVQLEYENDNLSPLWASISNKNYHVNGNIEIWITQPEMEFFMNHGFDVKIKEAHHILKSEDHEQPFKELIHNLYEKRLEAKKRGDPIQLTYKIILNSIYGVTINVVNKQEISDEETDDFIVNEDGNLVFYKKTYKASNMYNPLFATYITAQTRAKLFNDFYKHLDKLISINTDGVYLLGGNGVKVSKKLGDYSKKSIDKIMVLGSGRYFSFVGDEVDNAESKFRSIPKSPSEIFEMMKDAHTDHLSIERQKPIKLKESVKIKDYRDRFNEFRSITKNVYFKIDRRYWYDEFNTIDDIFDKTIESRPFYISELDR